MRHKYANMFFKWLTIILCVYEFTSTSCAPSHDSRREKRAPQNAWWLDQSQGQNSNTDQNNQQYDIVVFDSVSGTTSKPTVIDFDFSPNQGSSVNYWKTQENSESTPYRNPSLYDNRASAPTLPSPNSGRVSAFEDRSPPSPALPSPNVERGTAFENRPSPSQALPSPNGGRGLAFENRSPPSPALPPPNVERGSAFEDQSPPSPALPSPSFERGPAVDDRPPSLPALPSPNFGRGSAFDDRPPSLPDKDKSFYPPENSWGSNDTQSDRNNQFDWEQWERWRRWRRRGWGGGGGFYPRGYRGWGGYGRGPHFPPPYHGGWGYGNYPHRRGPPSPYDSRPPNEGDPNDRQPYSPFGQGSNSPGYDRNLDGFPDNNNYLNDNRTDVQIRSDYGQPSNRRKPGGVPLVYSDGTSVRNNFQENGKKNPNLWFQAMPVTPEN